MRIDLHVHAAERSPCARSGEEEVLRTAVERGLAGLVFTDHHALVPTDHMRELRSRWAPFRIYTGIEVTTTREDFLVLGIHDACLESRDWDYADLRAFVRENDGALVLAHPLRYDEGVDAAIEADPPDAMEVRSVNMADSPPDAVRALLETLGCAAVTNSDSHIAETIGLFANEFDPLPDGDADLVDALLKGRFRCESNE